jgi:uncharacterized protein (TIGR01244 family)
MTVALMRLSPGYAVAPQIGPDDVAEIARLGFKAIVNNRPDFEGGPAQPTGASVEAAAKAAGLDYLFFPVGSGIPVGPEQVAQFAERMRALPQPVFVYCRSGTRSSNLLRACGLVG